MQIKLNLQIFVFLIIFYFTKQIESFCILMVFAVIHELAHIITGILLGLKPKTLKLMPFGVSIYFEKYNPGKNKKRIWQKIVIASAGPICNMVIALLVIVFNIGIPYVSKEMMVYSNLLIAVFNLIPIYPLDGGRILKEVIRLYKNNKTAIEITHNVSYITIILLSAISSIMILYIHNFAIILIILYLWMIVLLENRKYKLKKRVYGIIEQETHYQTDMPKIEY